MSYRVHILPPAADDLDKAARWIARDSSSRAVVWLDGISAAIQSLSEFPNRCPLAPESDVFAEEIRQLLYRSYRILFIVEDDIVKVLHVRHGARRLLSIDEYL